MHGALGDYAMSRDSSGTSWQPEAALLDGLHRPGETWMFMIHGALAALYTHQGGPRGGSQSFNESMLMLMARRPVESGDLNLRAMISAEPLMGPRGYPLLFQTGESANGRDPLIDRQHPHNLLMEISAAYSRPLGASSRWFIYAGPVAEPALGPPAFMHRLSAQDNPDAPLTHHWLDSTHVAFGVVTAGLVRDAWKLEVSSFNGREPDQHRYGVQLRGFDSAAVRVSYNPSIHWALQVSAGRLARPEQLERTVAVRRTTFSSIYDTGGEQTHVQVTFAWGRNEPGNRRHTDGYLLESAVRMGRAHTFFARLERVAKDELFEGGDPLHGRTFNITKSTAGYVYDFAQCGPMRFGVGAALSQHWSPGTLNDVYGPDPSSWTVFARVKLAP